MKTESTTTAAVAGVDRPLSFKKYNTSKIGKYRQFDVPSDVFRRFETGRNKYERWKMYLDEEDENQAEIIKYAKSHPNHTIILRCADNGAMRSIRRRAANENRNF